MRDCRGCHRDEEDRQVVTGAEHHCAGERDGSERQNDRERGQPDELESDRRESPDKERGDEAQAERRQRDDDREQDHGVNR